MPIYEIEGKRVQTDTPLSEDEIDEIGASIRAQQQTAPAAPQEQALGTVDTGNITSGFMMGLKDPITAGAQMLPRGLEAITSAGGYYPNVVSQFFGSEAARVDAMAAEEEKRYQAARAMQGREGIDLTRMTGNVVNPANLAIGMRGAQLLRGAPMAQAAGTGAAASMLQPITDTTEASFGEQKAKQAAVGGVAGPVGNVLVQGLGRVASPLVTKAEQTMRDLGVTMTPGQLMGTQAKAIEEFAQNIPLIGPMISSARERQLFQFNRGVINKALRKVDEKLPDDVIGRDAVAHVQQVVSQKYDDVLANVSMTYDKELATKIGEVIPKSKIAGAAKKQELNDLLDSLVYSQVPVDNKIVGQVSGEAFKTIETNINRKIAQYAKSTDPNDLEIADALSQALKVWRAELMSQNPKYAQQLSKINAAYSDITVMEAAAANGGAQNGVFTPKNYQTAVRQRDMSRRKRAFAAGKAKGQEVSDAAVETIAPVTGATTEGRVAMSLAGGYGALQNPAVAAGAYAATKLIYSPTGLKVIEAIATRRPDLVRKIGEALKKRGPREGSISAAEVMKEYQRQTGGAPFEGQ